MPNHGRVAGSLLVSAGQEAHCRESYFEIVRLNVPKEKTALSNMNQTASEELSDGTVTYSFARSPIMSSYLLAFAVGEYDFVEAKTKNDVLVRVYTDKGCSAQGWVSMP